MAEILVRFTELVRDDNNISYRAQASGAAGSDGLWEGWIEFIEEDGRALRTPRETTQPNRDALLYWAEGLTAAYLEGALRRALHALREPAARVPVVEASLFSGPASTRPASASPQPVRPVLDPFSTFAQGEDVLRHQLSALSRDHLVAVIGGYELPIDARASATDRELVEHIVQTMHLLSTRRMEPDETRSR
ncbi:MAG TPA: hypothetical protein VGJ12_09125 [Gemmatimonadaceae bacterium]|jgi:hypothetical protein